MLPAALGAGYLPYRIFGPDGAAHALRLSGKLHEIQLKNLELSRANRGLRRDVRRLKANPEAMERVARDELGLVKPNDLIFQFE